MGIRDTFSAFMSGFFGRNSVVGRGRTYASYGGMIESINSASIYLNTIHSRVIKDVANMKLQHVKSRVLDDQVISEPIFDEINYVLNIEPNIISTPTTFWMEVTSELLINGLAVVLPLYNKGKLQSLNLVAKYIIRVEENGHYIVEIGGKTFDFKEVLIFRNPAHNLHSNVGAFARVLDNSISAVNKKITEGSSGLKGFLKMRTNAVDEEMMQKAQQRVENIMNVATSTGIGYLDKDEDFVALSNPIEIASVEQLEFLKRQLQENYGINENILSGKYSELEYKAYLQNVIKPFQRIIVEELKKKLFTRTAITQGHEIELVLNPLEFATNKEIAEALQSLKYIGMISANEGRKVIGYPSYVGGDKYETNANAVEVADSGKENNTGE